MKKLSRLQRIVLRLAKQHGHVTNADILITVYGFEQTVYTRVNRFERQHIGKAHYLSA